MGKCKFFICLLSLFLLCAWHDGAQAQPKIIFGTDIDAESQIAESRNLARNLAAQGALDWNKKGDRRLLYYFEEAGEEMPFRVCVPDDWDGKSKLPLVMFLHGGWNDESSYLDEHDKQMVRLANEHGYLLLSPLGAHAAYGNFLLLPAVFGQPEQAEKILSNIAPERIPAQRLSEKDVINVLEIVLAEFPVDRKRMFLTGHSMGSGGTWYLGAKYHKYWRALAPMSGPFLTEEGYPWKNIKKKPLFVTEGTLADASLQGSRDLRDWLNENGFRVTYKEVVADHPGMVPMVLPDVFDFFDEVSGK